MATIALYADKVNQMPGLINDVRKSVIDFKSELSTLNRKVLRINRSVCNVDDVISSIKTSTQTQENKIISLGTFHEHCKHFIADAVRIDKDVAHMINQRKNDFFRKYDYLKPESEKSTWERACDTLKSIGQWCKENWESALNILLAIIVIVGVVALCVVTFGAGAVIVAAIVGGVLGVLSQLTADLVSWGITGDWDATWQSYAGSLVGGVVGGILLLTGNPVAACGADAAISTFISQHLENITGGQKRSSDEIWLNTTVGAATGALLSKALGKVSDKLATTLVKAFPALSGIAGKGSFSAAFKMVTTKLAKGQIKDISWNTVRNGIVGGLIGDSAYNIVGGILDGVSELFNEWRSSLQMQGV